MMFSVVKRKLERCGLKDMRRNKRTILLQMLNYLLQKVNLRIKYYNVRMLKLSFKHK